MTLNICSKIKKKNNIICIFLILCLNFTICCESSNSNFFIKTSYFYEKAKKKLKENNFNDAIYILETIKKKYAENSINDKIQINLIYAYYKKMDLKTAQKNTEEFIRIYPLHPNMDYIIYMQCLIQMAMDKNIFSKNWLIHYEKEDPYYATNAFFQLKNLIKKYPKSLYVINAKKHLIDLKYRLSEHDLKILEFYFLNKEYIAVINRGEEIIQKYSETPAARKALVYMKESYSALKIFQTARKISQIIALNNI